MSKDTRIDIAVSEQGASAVLRDVNQLASAMQRLSPATARSLRGLALRVGMNLEKAVEDVAVAVLDKVVHTTPHDTGQARANWQVTVRAARPPTTPLIGKLDYDGDATVAEGTAKIRGTPRPDGHVVFITNALPYIQALNEGHSQQAPAGFVELAVQAGAVEAERIRVLK